MPSMLPLPFAACARPRCLRTTRATNPGLSTIDGQCFLPFARAPIECSSCFLNPTECEIECTKHRLYRSWESCLAFEVIQIVHIHELLPMSTSPSSDARRARVAKNNAKTHWSLLSAIRCGRTRLDDSLFTSLKTRRFVPVTQVKQFVR